MGIIDKIGEAIFDAQWYIFDERPIRKSLKRFNKDMDKAINTLNRTIEKCSDTMPEKIDNDEETCDQQQKFKKRRFI